MFPFMAPTAGTQMIQSLLANYMNSAMQQKQTTPNLLSAPNFTDVLGRLKEERVDKAEKKFTEPLLSTKNGQTRTCSQIRPLCA